jgi:hypothetical protein
VAAQEAKHRQRPMRTDQGTSGRLWEFLPDRTWAEILSGLRPDMVAGISGQTEKIYFFFPRWLSAAAYAYLVAAVTT